jgi:outer membrane protein OmpA-like peptidoglycan-associated protein
VPQRARRSRRIPGYDGCPDPDNDGDGIPDAQDKCPDKAETKNGIDDEDGCPEEDPDGDGIVGSADKCPDLPEDKDGFQDEDGCPDPDNDGDGVPDAQDKCPKELETKNGYQDDDGCPDELPAAVKRFTGIIKGITFKAGSADIQKASFKLLGDAGKVMKDYPDLRMEISGHTSSDGDPAKNVKLSQNRSDAVRAYLISAGIAADRMLSVGFGSDKPIGDNKTKAGREKNRRIEFRLMTADDAKPAAGTLEGSPSSAPTTGSARPPAPISPARPRPRRPEEGAVTARFADADGSVARRAHAHPVAFAGTGRRCAGARPRPVAVSVVGRRHTIGTSTSTGC